MKNADYWKIRSEQILLENERRGNRYLNRINRVYHRTSQSLDKRIQKVFDTYQGDFTPEQTKQWLNESIPRSEYDRLKADLVLIQDEQLRKEVLMRLNAPAYRYRISRLQYIQQSALTELSKAADIQLRLGKDGLEETLSYAYNRTMFDIQQGAGIAFDFAQLPNSTVNKLLSAKWYGRNFSQSVWRNTHNTAASAAEVVISGVLSGQSVRDMSKDLMEKTKSTSMYNASRLIRTETNHFNTQGALASYKEAGVDGYEYLATLEAGVTCDLCAALDGKPFTFEEEQPGLNSPPMHPNCRCTVIPIINQPGLVRMNKRAARDPLSGKTVVVENINYSQWKAKYVDNPGGSGIISPGSGQMDNSFSGALTGALDPDSKEAEEHSVRYYESVRKMKTDCESIANHVGWKKSVIESIKNHVFYETHDLGGLEPEQFDPDYHMAVSWQRLIEGNGIQKMDIVLLKHEYLESMLMKHQNLTYREAHDLSNKLHNYSQFIKKED